jgi:hypothetical protein
MKSTPLLAAALVCASFTLPTAGQIFIDVGDHNLLPDRAGQEVSIFVTGGMPIAGLSLNVQIADGFPDVPGSLIDGPDITGIDVETDTIFDSNNTGAVAPVGGSQLAFRYITTASGTVPADGLLATFTFDTTGLFSGVFDFQLDNVFGLMGPGTGPTQFFDGVGAEIAPSILDGTLTIVPEPAQAASLIALSALVTVLGVRYGGRGISILAKQHAASNPVPNKGAAHPPRS